jgi:hypothetical protein
MIPFTNPNPVYSHTPHIRGNYIPFNPEIDEGERFKLVMGRCSVRVPARVPDIVEVSVVFLSFPWDFPEWYLH